MMRQIRIQKPAKKSARTTTYRTNGRDIDLRTPSGRLLRY
jgi:hypothetical protein